MSRPSSRTPARWTTAVSGWSEGYGGEERGELLAVGGVAAGHGDLRVQAGEVVGGGAAAPGQHEAAYAVLGDQVPGDQGAEARYRR